MRHALTSSRFVFSRVPHRLACPAARFALVAVALTGAACAPEVDPNPPVYGVDAGPGSSGGGPKWDVSTLAEAAGGRHLDVAYAPDGTPHVAFFESAARTGGPCTIAMTDPPPDLATWRLLAGPIADGALTAETVDDIAYVSVPTGLDFAFSADGTAHIATMGGPPVGIGNLPYCGANDATLYRRTGGAWQAQTVVATGDVAITGEEASDYGQVVGQWAALAFDSAGQTRVAYRDVHAGGIQSDDTRRADLELATGGGAAFTPVAVDWGQGAGTHTALAVDGMDRSVLAYGNPTSDITDGRNGVWAARENGATFDRVRLSATATAERIAMAFDADGQLNVLFYDASLGQPMLATLVDDAAFTDLSAGWTVRRIGDARFDEGYFPSLQLADGELLAGWYRCARASQPGACDPDVDGPVFAEPRGDGYDTQLVDTDRLGDCGTYAQLVVTGSMTAMVYQCADQDGDDFVFDVRMARRR